MIERYSTPEMQSVWTAQNKYQIWLEVELLALEGMAKEGLCPVEDVEEVRAKASFDVQRIDEIEAEVKHDVIAFLTNVAEYTGPKGRFLHRGMTSSDLLDTAFAVQLKSAGELIMQALDELINETIKRAEEFKYLPCIGRSHGIHAEPTSMGIKILSWYSELKRHHQRIEFALQDLHCGKIAGAVGTYASISPEVEEFVLSSLGLRAETVPTQIVHRDRHANFFAALAGLGSSIERFCVEIRHLQRTEVREVAEKFTKGQKGSSAMPHKMNPILTENLTGIARLLRSYAQSAFENVPLWHERDISHSSVERVIAPDATVLCHFMLKRFQSVVQNMVVFPEQVQHNLEMTRGCVFSGTLLLALVDAGFTREESYALVQKHALAAWAGGPDLYERVKDDSEIMNKLPAEKLEDIFSLDRHLKHVDLIFDRSKNI